VAKRIRATPQIAATPIIMLTARGEEDDVVAGLDAGADDYVVKPFSLKVLLARVRRQLARPAEASESERQLIQRPGLIVDADRHKVLVEGQEVVLTSSEFKALFFMAGKPGRIFTRNQIMEAVHGEGYIVTERAIDVMIVGLRRKLEGLGEQIETVRGVGYRMAEPA
jgi:two-component system phosphate regulon response regulator PhoB